ncbi:hypothetical protein [Leuconostoc citreum]|uniref:hypothetical protein n=1 Tax=Leuconostoc citreum TaxID=33964 RepID=UPI0032DEC86B
MSNYDLKEKEIIAIESDLLNNPLTLEEKLNIAANKVDDRLFEKISYLLRQGVKLGIELEKLSQRGVQIVFYKDKLSNSLFKYFVGKPRILFVVGNLKLLKKDLSRTIYSYSDFQLSSTPTVFITDRSIKDLLLFTDIIDSISKGKTILVSDRYYGKSNINTRPVKKNNVLNQSNKKVFISGSRTQEDLPRSVQKSLEAIKKQKIEILVGDSEKGVDNEIINYLRLYPKYPLVNIYHIKQKPRVKVEPEWNTHFIATNQSQKPQHKQMVKDRVMATEADWGLAIFNPIVKNRYNSLQVSSGTLRNTIQLLLNKKAVKFFFVINGNIEVQNLKSIDQLKEVLQLYQKEKLTEIEKHEILTSQGVNLNDKPAQVKYGKIYKKFEELLNVEIKDSNMNNTKKNNSKKNRAEQISIFKFK